MMNTRAHLPSIYPITYLARAASCALKLMLLLSLGLVAQADQATLLVPGSTVTLTVTADGSPPFSYQWKKNGATIVGATRSSLVLAALTTSDAGYYSAVVTNFLGSTASDFAIVATPPAFTTQPANPPPVPAGGNATFSVTANSALPPALRWQVSTDDGVTWANLSNSVLNSGATTSALTETNTPAGFSPWVTTSTLTITGLLAGSHDYRVRAVVAHSLGSTTSATASLGSRLVNLSVRAAAGSGDAAMIVGFVIEGAPAKSLLVRGIGPTLGLFGVPDALSEPILTLYSETKIVATNDNWESNVNAAQIVATSARLGAFALPPGSRDAVVLSTLGRGVKIAELSGHGTAKGPALVELYDADPLSSARLVNVSTRTAVGAEDRASIVGFVIAGNLSKQLLLRAIGPTLQDFGVPGALPDPQLALYRQGADTPLLRNDNWGGTAALKSAFKATGAFALSETGRDAALLVTLVPGPYTVQVSGVENATGVVLIEVYELP